MADLPINDDVTIPAAELRESFARSGGPGGQNVNKVASKAELRWNVRDSVALDDKSREWLLDKLASRLTNDGELIVTSDRTRDQTRNRQDARDKLAVIIRTALSRPKPRKKTRPGKGAVERRIQEKKRLAQTKRNRRTHSEE